MSGRQILEELKQQDYECYCHLGFSHLSEEQWDYVIRHYEELRKLDKQHKANKK